MIHDVDAVFADRLLARCKRQCFFGGDNTTTTSSSSAPWSGAQPYILDLLSQAKQLYGQGSSYAPFSTVAPFSPQTLQGLDMTQNIANQGSPNTNAASGAITNLLQSRTSPGQDVLSQWSNPNNINPYLNAQFNAASKPVIDAVNAQFSLGGRTGSTANQDALTTRLGDLAANIYAPGYENAANRSVSAANNLNSNAIAQGNQQIAAGTLAPSLDAARYAPAQNLLGVGGAYDTQANKYIQDALTRWNYGQDQPWNLLSKYAGIGNGVGNYAQTTSSATAPTQSPIPSLLGAGVNLLSSDTASGSSLFSKLLGY